MIKIHAAFQPLVFILLLTLVFAAPAVAQPKLAFEPAFPKLPLFTQPVFLTHVPDGSDRIVVVEQGGKIYIFPNKPDVRFVSLMGDFTKKVRTSTEEGLIGFAFHPKFAENRQVFVNYTALDEPRRSIVARFKMDEKRAKLLTDTEEVILEVKQPQNNHNGGMMAFGKDGFLYIGFGDGGGGGDWPNHGPIGNGQNKNALLGKILRIDVDQKDAGKAYAIPKDNPFVGDENARPEVFAYGLRNPWRFSFDRKTDVLWAGDVGQYEWEEIDIIEKGKNYGWNIREATHYFRTRTPAEPEVELTPPAAEHGHGEAKCIIGGYVYRGKTTPDLDGWYLYGDFVTKLCWAMRIENGKPTKPVFVGQAPTPPASFGEDEAGEIYLVGYSGTMYRLVAEKKR